LNNKQPAPRPTECHRDSVITHSGRRQCTV